MRILGCVVMYSGLTYLAMPSYGAHLIGVVVLVAGFVLFMKGHRRARGMEW